jgi:transcriptional regulator GlxA family with amidase domain
MELRRAVQERLLFLAPRAPPSKGQIRQLSCHYRQVKQRVGIVVLDGVLDSAFGVTVDLLSTANRVAAVRGVPVSFDLRVVSASRRARSSSGQILVADATFRDAKRYDVVIALGLNAPLREDVESALDRADVRAAVSFLATQARRALVCASCSGTFVLAETGLLDGHAATTSWWLAPVFRSRYPRVELRDDTVVVARAGRIITGGAAFSQIDLVLRLVRRFAGAEVTDTCARLLVIDERPTQARYAVVDHLAHDSEEVRGAENYIRRNLQRPLSVDEIARSAGVSPRTLARRVRAALGLSPLRLVQRLRVEQAAHLLDATTLPFDAIARRVGYEDPGALRSLLRRELGVTARDLRRPRSGP